jgi:hypothetical protein
MEMKAPVSMPNGKLSGRAKPSRLMKKPASRKKRSKKFKGSNGCPKRVKLFCYGPDEKKQAENERERQRLSTKAAGGQCQSCGLKKCRKTCNSMKVTKFG